MYILMSQDRTETEDILTFWQVNFMRFALASLLNKYEHNNNMSYFETGTLEYL